MISSRAGADELHFLTRIIPLSKDCRKPNDVSLIKAISQKLMTEIIYINGWSGKIGLRCLRKVVREAERSEPLILKRSGVSGAMQSMRCGPMR
jgi:hypothetical protein